MKEPFSVLMSIYIKEKPEYVRSCFQSLLAQTIPASEWVIVEDGPLTEEMYEVLDEYQKAYPGLIRRIPLENNQGLGLALRAGVPECANELIARMDTDDIAKENRFERQLEEFDKDPALSICSSYISEFEDEPGNIVAMRKVPLTNDEIREYQKKRDAFNHVAVMYKKQAVLDAGNYQSCPLMEDTLLWVNMLKNGAKGKNIAESLVYARIGKDMYERRGGFSYFKKYRAGRKRVLQTGYISYGDYLLSLVIQFCVAMIPVGLRGIIFKVLLHGKG